MGTFIVVVVGQIRHRKHEATSDENALGIADIQLTLNGRKSEE